MSRTTVALDTNLAVLLAVGTANPDYIAKHKRLRIYDKTAFLLLDELLGAAEGILWCPHVLAETSNLARYVNDPIRIEVAQALAILISRYPEASVVSAEASRHVAYRRLGLTDSVMLTLASTGATLLTDDLDLHVAALSAGHSTINFNEFRDQTSQ